MDYTIEKHLKEEDYDASSDELRSNGCAIINVWYGSHCGRKDLAYLDELAAKVREEYPGIGRNRMVAEVIRPHESKRYAGKLGLWVLLPLEEVLKLKADKKVACL